MTDEALWPGATRRVPQQRHQGKTSWRMARPDVFSVRRTSVEDYLQPMVHEVKVSRADLLSDLRHAAKRESYQWLSCETYYVLPAGVAEPHEIPRGLRCLAAERPDRLPARSSWSVRPDTCPASCRSRCGWPWPRRHPATLDGEATQRELGDTAAEDESALWLGARRRAAQGVVTREDLHRRRAHAVRVRRQARRPGPAVHAFADLAARHRGPPDRGGEPVGVLPQRSLVERRRTGTWSCAGVPMASTPIVNCWRRSRPSRATSDLMPANHRHLHWAQAKVYGALLCRQLDLAELTVSLVYFDIGSKQEAPALPQQCTAIELQAFFEALCERFIAWADAELAHRERRDAALTSLRFPHEEFRAGQRDLAKAVFNAARLGPLPAGTGTHRHRQDHRHAVSDAQGLPGPGTRQGLLPDGQGLRPVTGAGCTGDAPAKRARACRCG